MKHSRRFPPFLNLVVMLPMLLASWLCEAVTEDSIPPVGLPKGGVIIETESLESAGYPQRAIMLWMLNATKHLSPVAKDPTYSYSCPEETRGSYYSGRLRVSLVDKEKNTIINTQEMKESFDIPYRIRKGRYYQVQGPGKNGEQKAHVLFLKDYNEDGRALEFALFQAYACMGLDTALFGYSPKQDKAIQYQIRLEVEGDEGHKTLVADRCDYLFSKKSQSPGLWKYAIDYRGRGGSLDKYEVRYSPEKEMFEGTLFTTEAEEAK